MPENYSVQEIAASLDGTCLTQERQLILGGLIALCARDHFSKEEWDIFYSALQVFCAEPDWQDLVKNENFHSFLQKIRKLLNDKPVLDDDPSFATAYKAKVNLIGLQIVLQSMKEILDAEILPEYTA